MSLPPSLLDDLVNANRILANEGVLDAYGHVSVRHPGIPRRFLLSCSRSPELVTASDIVEYSFDGHEVQDTGKPPYMERYIHGAIYEARPDVHAVVHSHADEVLPFSITDVPLRPVLHVASDMGTHVPVWDISDRFGDTNMLVTTVDQGRDLARALGDNRVVLMRGHGFSVAGPGLFDAVRVAIYLPRNARVLMNALRMSANVKALSSGEVAMRSASITASMPSAKRAWEYWCRRISAPDCGCGRTVRQSVSFSGDNTP
jgi:HCOMODA/2-hydroxy-3-carboxy-muconic semialdehyde decarboxylase